MFYQITKIGFFLVGKEWQFSKGYIEGVNYHCSVSFRWFLFWFIAISYEGSTSMFI